MCYSSGRMEIEVCYYPSPAFGHYVYDMIRQNSELDTYTGFAGPVILATATTTHVYALLTHCHHIRAARTCTHIDGTDLHIVSDARFYRRNI